MTCKWIRLILQKFQQRLLNQCYLLLCAIILSWSAPVNANTMSDIPAVPADAAEAWLVTFGPGEIYWERFGHNAFVRFIETGRRLVEDQQWRAADRCAGDGDALALSVGQRLAALADDRIVTVG